MTLIIKKESYIYCANIGNILAFIFFSEKVFSLKFDLKQLTYDDSKLDIELREDEVETDCNDNNKDNIEKDEDKINESFKSK